MEFVKVYVVMGHWKTLHNEELYDMHTWPNIIWLSRKMRLARPLERMRGEQKCTLGFGG